MVVPHQVKVNAINIHNQIQLLYKINDVLISGDWLK